MATKLFVGKVSFNTTDDSLQTLFSQYGNVVSAQVLTDSDTGQSKGFGIVKTESQDDVQPAICAHDGTSFEERVSIARPRNERPSRANFRRS